MNKTRSAGPSLLRSLSMVALSSCLAACSVDTTAIGLGDAGTMPGSDSGGFDAGPIGAFPFISIVTEPTGQVTGDATVEFLLYDSDIVPVDVLASFDRAGSLSMATPSPGSNLLFGITADPKGRLLTFVWNSDNDVPGDVDDLTLCFQATSDSGLGNLACTNPFDVRNGDPAAADLRIYEVDTGDTDSVEIFNTGANTVDVSGFTLRWTDSTGTFDELAIADDITIGPGDYLILRENTGPNIFGIAWLGSNINWSGLTGGSAAFLDRVGNGIDFVRWGGSGEPPPAPVAWTENTAALPFIGGNDITLSRINPDTDDASDFCQTAPTLGSDNGGCLMFDMLAPGDLVINELGTGFPDWLEVVNTTAGSIDLLAMRVEWSSPFNAGLFTLPSYVLAPGERVVIEDDQGTPEPGVIVGAGNISWGTFVGGGSVAIYDANGNAVDFVRWGQDLAAVPPGLSFDDSSGNLPTIADTVTLGRDPDAVDTDTTLDFCVMQKSFILPNTPCLPGVGSVDLLITEIGVGSPDWVEITNVGATTTDLLGWRMIWARPPGGGGQQAGIYSLPSYVLAPGERVVLADDTGLGIMNELVFSGMGTNIAWGGPSGFGGAAGIFGPGGAAEDYLHWGSYNGTPFGDAVWSEPGGGIPAPTSNAGTVNRDETLGDNDVDTDWCVKMSADTAGLPNDTCP